MLIIRNAAVYTAEQTEPLERTDILCGDDGKILEIRRDIHADGAEIIDAGGCVVTPGLVDAHVHAGGGILASPAEQDLNEMTEAVTPQLNVINSIDICSEDFRALCREGVTAVCDIPGSSNVIGGQGIIMKTAGGSRIDDLVIKSPAVMKCAMGGNPKGVHGSKGRMPATRMGVSEVLRSTLRRAKRYLADLEAAAAGEGDKPPYDAGMEAMIPVLKKEIPVKVHCEQFDMVTLIRIAKEFEINYTIEHAWACSLYADELIEGGGTVCFGPIGIPEGFGELTGGDVAQIRELDERGLNVCIISDYPIMSDGVLSIEAGEAVRFGVPHDRVLRMVTINPAKSFDLEDRIGSIRVGKDADLVVWSAVPMLEESARVLYTIINSKVVYCEQ